MIIAVCLVAAIVLLLIAHFTDCEYDGLSCISGGLGAIVEEEPNENQT